MGKKKDKPKPVAPVEEAPVEETADAGAPPEEEKPAEEPKPAAVSTPRLTPEQAGKKLGVSGATVIELCEEGRLPGVKTDDGWLLATQLVDHAVAGVFKKGKEKLPALFVPGRGLRLAEFNGTRMWVSPTQTVRCPPSV